MTTILKVVYCVRVKPVQNKKREKGKKETKQMEYSSRLCCLFSL